MANFALFSIVAIVFVRFAICVRARVVQESFVSFTAALAAIFFLWLPAILQRDGQITSKLVGSGIRSVPTNAEIESLSLRWACELFIVLIAELSLAAIFFRRNHRDEPTLSDEVGDSARRWQIAAVGLVGVGFVMTLAFPVSLSTRGADGQGIVVILRSTLVCGLAILCYFRCFRSRVLFALLGVGVIVLVAGNVRSPLAFLLFAFLAGLLSGGHLYKRRVATGFVVLTVVTVYLASLMSMLRQNITREGGMTVGEIASSILKDPIAAPYSSGIDTLDGYRFVNAILPYENARPYDFLSPIYTFIPRSIWPTKPDSISVQVSEKYLSYKASGQFLSPIGNLSLATGSYVGALLAFLIVAGFLAWVTYKSFGTFWLSVTLLLVFRYFLNGSSFDFYYALTLSIPIFLAFQVAKLISVSSSKKSSEKRSAPESLISQSS